MDNRNFDSYFNEDGILGTLNLDQSNHFRFDTGDGAQKMGLLRFARYIKFQNNPVQLERESAKFQQELDMLESKDTKGWYVRSPAIGKAWWSDRYSFSRDQQRSIIIAMGALKQTKRLYRITWEHIKRGGWYQNFFSIDRSNTFLPDFVVRLFPGLRGFKVPDIAAPDHIGEYIRAFFMAGQYQFAVFYPVLLIADLIKLMTLPLSFKQWQNPDNSDEDNALMSVLQSKLTLPTPFSFIYRLLYIKYMPIMGYTDESKTIALRDTDTGELTGVVSAIAWKHRGPGAPPYIKLYGPILDEKL